MILTSVSVATMKELIQRCGMRAVDGKGVDGHPAIKSGSNGKSWTVELQALNSGATRLAFRAVCWRPQDSDHEGFCNEFNRGLVVGKLWHFDNPDEEGDVMLVLEQYSDMSGGVSEAWVLSEIENWDVAVGALTRRELED